MITAVCNMLSFVKRRGIYLLLALLCVLLPFFSEASPAR